MKIILSIEARKIRQTSSRAIYIHIQMHTSKHKAGRDTSMQCLDGTPASGGCSGFEK